MKPPGGTCIKGGLFGLLHTSPLLTFLNTPNTALAVQRSNISVITNNSARMEPNHSLILSSIDQNNAVLASTEAALAVIIESETIARSRVEKAQQALNDAISTHRCLQENLATLREYAQRIRKTVAMEKATFSVNVLPAELIEQIVLNARDSLLFPDKPTSVPLYPTKFMLGLLAVCSHWRRVLRGTPRVWQILPLQPSQRRSVELVAYLRPLVQNVSIHWWLYLRRDEFDEDMETFEEVHSSCMFEDGQFKSLTLASEPGGGYLEMCLRAPTVTTLVAGTVSGPTSVPSKDYPELILQPGALPALKTLELRGIFFDADEEGILPQLRTFVIHASPVDVYPYDIFKNILGRSPQLSKLKVDHCLSRDSSKGSAEPQRKDLPKIALTITKLEMDLIGFHDVLSPLADPISVFYEFCKPIKKLTLINHLYRLPSPASGSSPSLWKQTKVEYDSRKVKKVLSKIHGVERLYLRAGSGATSDSEVPFTLSFQTDSLAPLKDVQELVLQCAAGRPDEVRVTLEGLQQDANLFPRLRGIRLERCKTMTPVWETLLETVRVRQCISKVELVECGVVPGACHELDGLLAARRAS